MINSGSPTKAKYTAHDKQHALYAQSMPGLVELVYYKKGRVDYQIQEFAHSSEFKLTRQETLFSSPCDKEEPGVNFNTAFNPCRTRPDHSTSAGEWGTDTTVVAGDFGTEWLDEAESFVNTFDFETFAEPE